MVKQLKGFEVIVLLKQGGTRWKDTLYSYAIDIAFLSIKECGAFTMSNRF